MYVYTRIYTAMPVLCMYNYICAYIHVDLYICI